MLTNGQHLGRYKILSAIGAGGMGEVYLAEDTRLKRSVALKLLPSDFSQSEDRLRRFEQEALAVAALNHPNIAHIYEIGESDGTHFIAMEFVDGVTLYEKIHREKTSLGKLLKYLTQTAEGLAKAHAAGIVHRDLKPDNIMISRDDYAKILDFGLAKLVEPRRTSNTEGDAGSEIATAILAQPLSTPGMIMGTAGYMSPEQAQGKTKEIDHRSDIFSFGCILFEAATGRKAFEGKDALDSLHKIVYTPTPQIKDANLDAPQDLQRIIRRCLAKEADKRYQSIKDVAIELDELRQELKDKDQLEYSVQPQSNSIESAISSQQVKIVSTQPSATNVTQKESIHSTSSAEYLVSGIKSHKRMVFFALIGIVVVIASGIGLYKFVNWYGTTPPAPFQAMRIERLTSNGKATQAVISPDGKQVVYVVDDGGRRSLWLRQVATATDVQLAAPEDVFYWSLTVSLDGNFLYYVYGGTTIRNRVLYRMPLLGGSPRKVIEDVGSPIGFSPDGKQVAFVRSGQRESALMIANADGTEERKIAVRQGGGSSFGNLFQGGVAWSPDGKKIASIARSNAAGRFQNVVEVTIEDGTERPLTSQKWHQIHRLAWLADGSGLLMTAAEQPSDLRSKQIWCLSYPSGEARKITNDLNNYGSISLNADSSILVTVQEDQAMNIWIAPNGDARRAAQITSVSGKFDGFDGVAWTPDGKIVYHSITSGKEGIWIMEADGQNRRQLTTGETVDYYPSVSTDGRYIVFLSERAGVRSVWRMDKDGSNPKQLTDRGGVGNNPQATADWLVYPAGGLWKVPIDGGEPVQIGENMSRCAASPDGKLLACQLDTPGLPTKLSVIPIEGGSPAKVFDVKFELPARIRWSPDGRAVTYVSRQDGVRDIWSQPLDGGEPKRLTDFKADQIFSFDWSRDNKLVISHGSSTSDVILIKNVK